MGRVYLVHTAKGSRGRSPGWSRGRNPGGRLTLAGSCSIQDYHPGTGPPTVGPALPYQSPVKTISYRDSLRLIWFWKFLACGSLFPGDSRLCQVDNKLASTVCIEFFVWVFLGRVPSSPGCTQTHFIGRMTLNNPSSCLCLLSAGFIGIICHDA